MYQPPPTLSHSPISRDRRLAHYGEIRALPSPARDIPIIAFTAYAIVGSEQQVRAAGCDAYLVKPVLDFIAMKDKVEQLLTYGRAGRP